MSLLACSLLAFVALFAAADALKPNPYCNSLTLGRETKDYIDSTITVAGGKVNIPDKCSRPGRQLVGQYIGVCNTPNSKPTIIPAAMSEHDFVQNFGLVYIECPSNIAGCNKLDVHVTQYCEMFTGPH